MRIVVLLLVGLVASVGCTKANPNQCCTTAADCNAKGIAVDMQCAEGLVCRGNQCIAETCGGSDDCDAAAPYCVSQMCAEQCGSDSDCPGFAQDTSSTYCVSGACAQCRSDADCPTTAPTCDMGTCHGCASHADCASSLCDVDTSTCIPEAIVIYAAPTGDMSSDCTKTSPCTLDRAFAVVSATRNQIKLAPGTYTNMGVSVAGPNSVSVYGPATVNGGNGIGASNGGSLRIRDLTLNGATGCTNDTPNLPMNTVDLARVDMPMNAEITADVCTMTLSHVTMQVTSAAPAIQIEGEIAGVGGATANRTSIVTITNSIIQGGDPGIVAVFLGAFDIKNSVFIGQGTSSGLFDVGNARTTSTISFSTIYNTVLKCPAGQGNGSIASSNNIIVNRRSGAPADTITGVDCTHNYDLVQPQGTALSGTNNILGQDPRFAGVSINDFHLMMGSPAIDAADPAATLSTDFDGTARPQGARRDIGAFEYKP